MSGFRPGGLSDDEYSDEEQILDCDETDNKQYSNDEKAATGSHSQVWNILKASVRMLILTPFEATLTLTLSAKVS